LCLNDGMHVIVPSIVHVRDFDICIYTHIEIYTYKCIYVFAIPAEVVFFFETEMLVPNSPTRGTRTAEINMHFQPKSECRDSVVLHWATCGWVGELVGGMGWRGGRWVWPIGPANILF